MRLSTRARYALRFMISVAKSSNDVKVVSLNKLSRDVHISTYYLQQIVTPLRNAGLIKGYSGKDGGYKLSKKPEEIKVGEIIQTAIGPISITDCIGDPSSCIQGDYCECRDLYALINDRIIEVLDDYNLADMVRKNLKMEKKQKKNLNK